jgi:hypothetical protein
VDARDAVFVSYSRDDQDWRRKFTQMLAPLVRTRGLELWDDTHIPAGDDWQRNIDDAVRRAGVALLLGRSVVRDRPSGGHVPAGRQG